MNPVEPLKPDPSWRYTAGGKYLSEYLARSISHPPDAYAAGFEDGAYALADRVSTLFQEGQQRQAIELLGVYAVSRNARPAKGWNHEPPRS